MKELLAEIERALPDGGDWCDLDKANALAAIVIALRPTTTVEIGIWMGGSFVPMLLALKHIDARHHAYVRAIAIDPWSTDASLAGEEDPANVAWWGAIDHEAALAVFRARLERHGLGSFVEIWRKPSDECTPPASIDLIHIDGNHAAQALRDAERFLPSVRVGGIAVLDDVGWKGGHVRRAVSAARELGFSDLYPLGTGLVLQRTSRGAVSPLALDAPRQLALGTPK